MFSALRVRSQPPLRRRFAVIPAAGAALLTAPLLAAPPALAQQAGYGQTLGTSPMERQMYDGGSGRPNSGTILDSTNPLDLMNKIRRGTAMDDATPPASAIDQALQQLEAQSPAATPATRTAAGGVSGGTERSASSTPLWSQTGMPAPQPSVQSGSTPQRPAL
jgi:hypothetical protein